MISLPLAKLSTAQDTAVDATKFDWSHETQNLTVVIDSFGARGTSGQLLKVVQGTRVLHLIEIERLIKESNALVRTMQEHGVELKNEQLSISALVRKPLLALRCQLPDKKVRRFQLKFKNSHDYDTVYNYLRQLGLRISGSGEKQSRPSTSNTLSSATSSSSNLTTDRVVPAAGPSCPPSRLSEISHRPFTAVTAPTAVESQVQEAAHARPTSAYTGLPNKAPSAAMSFPGLLRPPEYFARPDSFTSSALESASASAATSSAYAPFDQPMATVEEHLDDRPETALLFNRPNTAEAPLPPRRELPFARSSIPRSSGSDTARPSSRPSTAMMGPPPLPARVASLRPPSSRSIALEAELPPLPKPTILDSAQRQPSWMQQPPRTPNQDHLPPPSSQSNAYDDQENHPPSASSSSSSPLSYKRSATNISPPARPLSGLSSSAQNRRHTESRSPVTTPPTSGQQSALGGSGGAPHLATDENLTAYAMQSEEDRRAALNEFVYKQVNDDNFIMLLEDMETCWARSKLGMR